MVTFESELKRMIELRYKTGQTYLIMSDVQNLAQIFKISAETAEILRIETEASLLEAWKKEKVKSDTPTSSTNPVINQIITSAGQGAFAKANGEIQQSIKKAVKKGLARNVDSSELIRLINKEFNIGKARAATTVRTARMGKIRTDYLIDSLGRGYSEFRFAGPGTDREVCSESLNKVFSIDEMINHEDVQGLAFCVYMGGFNCRHWWIAVK